VIAAKQYRDSGVELAAKPGARRAPFTGKNADEYDIDVVPAAEPALPYQPFLLEFASLREPA